MEHYLTTQRSTIFQHVGVLIYVFDVESREMEKDLQYYKNCLNSLSTFSPDAGVFVLIHKMDLVRGDRQAVFKRKKNELQAASDTVDITVFGTSIWDESLYKVCETSNRSSQCIVIYNETMNPFIRRPGLGSYTISSQTPPSSRNILLFSGTLVVQRRSSCSSAQPSLSSRHRCPPSKPAVIYPLRVMPTDGLPWIQRATNVPRS